MSNCSCCSYAVAVGVALWLSSCGQEEESPALPPVDTMQLDLSSFDQSTQALTLAAPDQSNYQNAALRVGLLNLSIGLHLVVPVAVFQVALSVKPKWSNDKWVWSFSKTRGVEQYAAVLSGWFDSGAKLGGANDIFNLEMKITCTTCITPVADFVWYEGRFDTGGRAGYWQFYDPAITQADQSLVRIDAQVTNESQRSLTFTNNRADGHDDTGDTILYERDGDTARVAVHDVSANLDYTVQWSVSVGSGFLQVPLYNNGDKACWDDAQVNVACP